MEGQNGTTFSTQKSTSSRCRVKWKTRKAGQSHDDANPVGVADDPDPGASRRRLRSQPTHAPSGARARHSAGILGGSAHGSTRAAPAQHARR
eukprot:4727298-Pleurochrysis_carterae.AAC.1